jgi:hypothetical protein
VREFYRERAPAELARVNVEDIATKWAEKEAEMWKKLEAKYPLLTAADLDGMSFLERAAAEAALEAANAQVVEASAFARRRKPRKADDDDEDDDEADWESESESEEEATGEGLRLRAEPPCAAARAPPPPRTESGCARRV